VTLGVGSLAAIAPSCPVASPARNEEYELLNPEQDRAKKGEDGYLGGLDRQVHAAAVGRHDDGDGAAIRQVSRCHESAESTRPNVERATGLLTQDGFIGSRGV
jgi:hypothetical protein